MRAHGLIGGVLIATMLAIVPQRARAQDEEPAPLNVRMGLNGKMATVSFDVTSAFTETFRRKLGGGLTSRVLIEIELVDDQGTSIATTVRACQLRLDVWEDFLFVGVTDENHKRPNKKYVLIDEALRECGVVSEVPIGELALLEQPWGYRVGVRVALNPVSQEVLDRTRDFMANPRGTTGGRPRAFFGAVSKLFRSDSAASGERFVFQSPRLARPRP